MHQDVCGSVQLLNGVEIYYGDDLRYFTHIVNSGFLYKLILNEINAFNIESIEYVLESEYLDVLIGFSPKSSDFLDEWYEYIRVVNPDNPVFIY